MNPIKYIDAYNLLFYLGIKSTFVESIPCHNTSTHLEVVDISNSVRHDDNI